MPRRILAAVLAILIAAAAGAWYVRRDGRAHYYTGFVEGEERVIRSEVSGRVLEVRYAEGATVEPEEVIAVLDARDIDSRVHSKERELAVLVAEERAQEERITLLERTWERDVGARRADLAQAESAAVLAERTFAREQELVRTGASTAQLLDNQRAQRDQARSAVDRAREVLARTEAEELNIKVARRMLDTLRARAAQAQAQLVELEVTRSKYAIRAPAVRTIVQTQLIWPGELAQPGTPILSLLDPRDKYVLMYVPVTEVARLRLGQRVEIELDSMPGERIAGEVSFIADRATFTPEKIETRSDRIGQVYRAKVRILERIEELQPGTEGNVYMN
jgi:HlyD family secretion protein